jgi:hypothetical protein
MENKETKSSTKMIKNRIILHNLSQKQKEVLMKMGIIGSGLGSGLFMLCSMKDPETIPGLSEDATPVKDLTESSNDIFNNSVEVMSVKPVTEIGEQNISFGEAFKVAREICGSGGWFIWKDRIYNTYYKEEWQALNQDERDDYLASIEIRNIQSHEDKDLTADQEDDSYVETIASTVVIEDDNKSTSNIQKNEFSIDLNAYNNQSFNTVQNVSDDNSDLITGEIITLDDDSDIIDNGYFELPDEIEIKLISDEESSLIDNLTFDSSEITSLPWETSDGATEKEVLTTEVEDITVDFDEDSNEHISDSPLKENNEYPWGEPIIKTTENTLNSQVLDEIQHEETARIISNPAEINEYPWGEPMENSNQNSEQYNSEIVIKEVNEEIIQDQSHTLDETEEYPWGEKKESHEPIINTQITNHANEVVEVYEENIGVILPEETEIDPLSKLPLSFNEITEFPWGETVPHSTVNLYTSPENDLFDNLTNNNRTLMEGNE